VNYSTKKGHKALMRYHDRVQDGPVVRYPPKPGLEEEAAEHRWLTGVCPDCHGRAITVGRCVQCGWELDR
jgi:hypothetical protein